ncbi:hypothetical protein PHYBLDRAFT_174996 [Phycomyces blakesleeanus NRRL 1555(-)]|uniref:Uncharacterized protein n=1 Tax=Phycomyces blakesleeanus (strain ATCC 8743b / DSM 1359 / FGSC 10004 / NBRC 33097 / NRRL 1555) TaxID=763407 RepID=A0A162T773_PHYB8|nr:hypothetical protein PHYBLDRAFT_174996 [Phycomyces blakesleeanus NRRL 1555(-)]OAD66702.1 hypothetical protein PHYBLDRAFT_174996 [Phycomyces blakesleeanus NRRL 1555(-)]|eukprot:XP_018284742.1 hypothetical protein PHYBLDRAFT_174996 [Phycomyces blakesleeanus NRRL 1555(-)]
MIGSTTSKRQIEWAIETRSEKQQKVKASQVMEQVEYDILYAEGNNISVGTTIKKPLNFSMKIVSELTWLTLQALVKNYGSLMKLGLKLYLCLELLSMLPDLTNRWLIISKSDLSRIVWRPIFELLLPPNQQNQQNLIIEIEDTVGLMSQEHK